MVRAFDTIDEIVDYLIENLMKTHS